MPRGSLLAPLPLTINLLQQQYQEYFRFIYDNNRYYTLQSKMKDGWEDLYTFDLDPYLPIDYKIAKFYCNYAKDSIFTQKLICSLPTKQGRKK